MAQSVLTASQKLAINFAFERLFRLSGLGENSVGFDVGAQMDALESGLIDHLLGNATDTGTATYIDNSNTLTGSSKLLSIRNNTVEQSYISPVGSFIGVNAQSRVDMQSSVTARGAPAAFVGDALQTVSNTTLTLLGQPLDGASAIGLVLKSSPVLANATAKLVSIKNDVTETAYVDINGGIVSNQVTGADAFKVSVNGARIRFGTGNTEYLDASGAGVITAHCNLVGQTSIGSDQFVSRTPANGPTIFASAADGSSAVGVIVDTFPNAFANATSKLFSVRNLGTEKLAVDFNGKLIPTYGDVSGANAGAGGAATSNTVIGRGAIASGASSCVITNSTVTTTSLVHVQLEATGVGIDSLSVSVGTGSFTVTSLAGAGATTVTSAKAKFSWQVIGA